MIRRIATGMVLGLGLTAAACQPGPQSVSLEEAKQITATIQKTSFTPPPKTINDITAILDQQKRADPTAAKRARVAMQAKSPAGLSGIELGLFYWDRGVAAGEAGRSRQEIADLKMANELLATANADRRQTLLWKLALAETFGGNISDAIRHRLESIRLTTKKGAVLARTAVMAIAYARNGNLEIADKTLAETEVLLSEARSFRSWPENGVRWTVNVDRGRAALLNVRGRYEEAEEFLRAALKGNAETLRRRPNDEFRPFVQDLILGDLAANLTRQGRLIEAEIEARKAVLNSLARRGKYSKETALMVRVLARVINAQGRYEDAEQLLRATIDIYQKVGAARESVVVANARSHLAGALGNQERWQEAIEVYETISQDLEGQSKTHRQRIQIRNIVALAFLNVGRLDEARTAAEKTYEIRLNEVGAKHPAAAAAQGILAMVLVRLGEHEAALTAFHESIPILLSRSRRTTGDEASAASRTLRLQWILESYLELLGDLPRTVKLPAGFDPAAEAFRLAQVARGGRVQTALAASSARAAARDPDLAELVRQEQDAQKRIAAFYGLLAEIRSVPTDQQDAQAVQDLRGRIDRLRSARAAIAEEISARFPEYWELVDPRPATIADARGSLHAGEALIATYVGPRRTFVWAVPKTGDIAFAVADLERDAIFEAVGHLRSALEPNAATLGDIPPFDVSAAHTLYQALLEPVKTGWGGAKSLLVVAHGPLGYLPFSLLPTKPVKVADTAPLFSGYRDVPWLARDHAVTVLPSVTSLRTLRALPAAPATRKSFVGFGDPHFSKEQETAAKAEQTTQVAMRGLRLRSRPRTDNVDSAQLAMLPRLPDTGDEVRGMAGALKADMATSVFLGKDASETAVKAMDLSGVKVVAFATHGLVPGDLDGLTQSALALTSPDVAGGGNDGLLTMGEILGLRLNADWVVLSACNTGAGEGAGAEAVSGLGRAFFYAGTRALLVSNWPVETTSARMLTTTLFAAQADDPDLERAQALRRAMLALIDGDGPKDAAGNIQFSYAHPLFWAPFSLIGDGGGTKPKS